MPISIHTIRIPVSVFQKLLSDMLFKGEMNIATIPAGATITRALERDGDYMVMEYTVDDGKPTECTIEIGVSDDLQYVECYSDPYLLDTAEKVEWANKVSAPMKWVLGDNCYYKPGKVEFK